MRLWVLVLATTLAPAATAQPADSGAIGISFSASSMMACEDADGFEVIPFYLLGVGLTQFSAWESSIHWTDPSWTIVGSTLHPPGATNAGSVGNFLVDLGACVDAGPLQVLVSYEVGYFGSPIAPDNVFVCVGPAEPASFDHLPGYWRCDDTSAAFRLAETGRLSSPNGCGVINDYNPWDLSDCVVAVERSSWSRLKARFD